MDSELLLGATWFLHILFPTSVVLSWLLRCLLLVSACSSPFSCQWFAFSKYPSAEVRGLAGGLARAGCGLIIISCGEESTQLPVSFVSFQLIFFLFLFLDGMDICLLPCLLALHLLAC